MMLPVYEIKKEQAKLEDHQRRERTGPGIASRCREWEGEEDARGISELGGIAEWGKG